MKKRSSRNQTLTCSKQEILKYSKKLIHINKPVTDVKNIKNKIINQDLFECIHFLPKSFVDLLIIDPPYNITKNYNGYIFKSKKTRQYKAWFELFIKSIIPTLKPEATIYVCSEWQTSNLIFPILNKYFFIHNRITWEREKGRGARYNWKNSTEDIWFCTLKNKYYFNVELVKLKRYVITPYRTENKKPKGWKESNNKKFRLTYPSNFWGDITIPFWSMPENTDHPTQKPEKLIAKLILASSKNNDFILDPFLGSGTTAVVAKKLNRQFLGIELNTEYCCWAKKRLYIAREKKTIQGYDDGVFWERNSK